MNQLAINLITKELADRGVKPSVIVGVIAGIMGESYERIDPTAFNPNDPGGGAGGILQWNRERLVGDHGLLAFARANGIDVNTSVPTDSKKVPLLIQVKFMGHELDNQYNGVLKGLQSLNTSEEGLHTWVHNMEVPRDPGKAIAERQGFIPGVAKAFGQPATGTGMEVSGGAATGAGAGAAPGAAQTPAQPPSELSQIGSALGSALSGLTASGSGLTGSTGGSFLDASQDQPAIRAPALGADFTPPPANPVPVNIAAGAGSSPLGAQLGSLAAAPGDPMLENPNIAPSITAGAPSMTSLIGGVGGAQVGNIYDPRRPNAIQPGLAYPRLG
jgi:hypothetical protein